MKKVIIAIIIISFATLTGCDKPYKPVKTAKPAPTLKGTWQHKTSKYDICDKKDGKLVNCKNLYSVPGHIKGCKAKCTGTMTFQDSKQGFVIWIMDLRLDCPKKGLKTIKKGWKARFWVFKKEGKTYIRQWNKMFNYTFKVKFRGKEVTFTSQQKSKTKSKTLRTTVTLTR